MSVLSVLLFVIIPLLWLSLPILVPSNSPLGVSVPVTHQHDPVVRSGWRRFTITNFVVAAVLAAVAAVCSLTLTTPQAANALAILIAVQVFALVPSWWWAGQIIRREKAEKNWFADARVEVAGSLTPGTQANMMPRVPTPWPLHLGAYLVTGLTALYLWLQWDTMPALVPNTDTTATGDMVEKSVSTVFGSVLLTLGLVTILLLVSLFLAFNPGRFRTATSPSARLRARRLFEAAQLDLGWLNLCYSLGLSALALTVAPPFTNITDTMHGIGTTLLLMPVVAVLAHLVKVSKSVEVKPGEGDSPNLDTFYKLGLFYVNKDDPALFVDRRAGVGMDVNWGNPKAALVVLGFLALIAALVALPFAIW